VHFIYRKYCFPTAEHAVNPVLPKSRIGNSTFPTAEHVTTPVLGNTVQEILLAEYMTNPEL
jgi:hypothetical protein